MAFKRKSCQIKPWTNLFKKVSYWQLSYLIRSKPRKIWSASPAEGRTPRNTTTSWRIAEDGHRASPTVKKFYNISGSGQFFCNFTQFLVFISIHFVNLFPIWFKKGACLKDASDSSWFEGIYKLQPTTFRVSHIHLESKILIFVTKLRPRQP